MKITFLLITLLAALMLTAPAMGLDPINETWRGIAIEGYDPVAYFTDGKPVKGDSDFEHEWKDSTWRFASAKSRDAFAADPEKYAPQYGGYCAYAVSQNSTAGIDPDSWTILGGKLYLNYNAKIQKKWEADRDAYIEQADKNWPELLAK